MKVQNIFKSELNFPLLCKYPQQSNHQPAYILLNCETGEIDADYSSEIGNGCSSRVWHNLDLEFSVPHNLRADEVTTLIDDNLELFQKIVDGFDDEWDGSNWVGVFTEEAQTAQDDLQQKFRETICDNWVIEDKSEFEDYVLTGGKFPADGQSIEEFIEECNDLGDLYYDDGFDVRDTLFDVWADALYDDGQLPKIVAQALLDDGRCNDSQWIDELKAMAE